MTTVEKLLMQIFERKIWIIEQAKKQAELYNQHLASKLVIDGIPPPSWLLSPNNSDSKELNKEELISRLLRPHPQPPVCCSRARYPLYSSPIGTGNNSKFSDVCFTDTLTSEKGLNGEDHPRVPDKSGEDDVGYTLKNVSEVDSSITSLGEQPDERILSIHSAPDPSLVRIQRSKSRQKALEFRSGAKSLTKNGHDNVNDNFRLSIFSTKQVDRNDEHPELTEDCGISESRKKRHLGMSDFQRKENDVDVYTGTVTRSRSCVKSPDFVGGFNELGCTTGNYRKIVFSSGAKAGTRRSTSGLNCNQTDYVIQLQKSGPSTASFQSCAVQSLDVADCQGRDIENNVHTVNNGMSECSCRREGDPLKGDCCYDNADRNYNFSMQFRDHLPANYAHGPRVSVSGANVFDEGDDPHQSTAEANEKEMDFAPRMTRSRSSSQHNTWVDETLHEENISSHFNEADSGPLPLSNRRLDLLTNAPSKEPGLVKPSFGTFHRGTRLETLTNQEISNHVDCLNNPHLLGKISKSDLENKSSAGDELLNSSGGQIIPHCYETHYIRNEQQGADNALGSELALCDLVDQSISSGPTETKKRGELESLVAQAPSAFVEPKELDLNMLEDNNWKTFTSSSGKKRMNNMSEKMDCFFSDPAASIDKGILGNIHQLSIAEESTKRSNIGSKGDEVWTDSFDYSVQENPEAMIEKYAQCVSSCPIDTKQGGELEFLVAQPPSASVDPKELDVNMHEDYNLKTFTSRSGKKRLNNIPEKIDCFFSNSAASINKGILDNINQLSITEESTERSKIRSKAGEVWTDSFDSNVQENLEAMAEKYAQTVGELKMSIIFQNNTEAGLNREIPEVRDEVNLMQSVVDDTPDLHFDAVKPHLGHKYESLPVQHSEEGNQRGEGKGKVSLVSIASGSNTCRGSSSVDLTEKPSPESHDGLVEKGETENPACDTNDKIKQIHTEDCQVLPCLEVEGCGQHVDISLGESGLMITSSNRSPVFESWSQLKRRKIKHQHTNGHNTPPCGSMKKLHSIQRGSSTYLMNTEKDVDLMDEFRVAKSTDMEINELIDFNLTELESTSESHNGENQLCRKEQNEHKSFSTANEQSEIALVASLTKKKAGNSEGNYVERISTHSSFNHLDASDNDNKQYVRQPSSLDKNIVDYSNCGNITLDQSTISSEWKDDLQSQHLVLSPFNINQEYSAVDESLPVFEGFMVDAQSDGVELDFSVDEVGFDKLRLPRTTIERASILAKICKSASMDTPLSDFSSELELLGAQSSFNSASNSNGLLENLDTRSILHLNGEVGKQFEFGNNHANNVKDCFERMPYSDCLPHYGARYGLNSRNLHASPVGMFWERLSLHPGSSSEKRMSTNPDLTCFRIEEDPCVSEENVTMDAISDDVQDDMDSLLANPCDKRQPLKEMTNLSVVPHISDSTRDDICRVDNTVLVRGKPIVNATQYKVQQSLKKQTSSLGNTEVRKKQTFSVGGNGLQKAKESICSSVNRTALRSKSNLKRKEHKLSLKEPRKNNIVANVNSFLPLVQQKQAASICAGKREVKVKALEAAEAARRLHERRENERKIKKEALKHERAMLEEQNLRLMELEKKKKEDERKKKDADIIVKKRLREENERKEKEKKRMRFEERQRQREQDEKLCAKKAENEREYSKGEKMNIKKDLNELKKPQNKDITRRDDAILTNTDYKWAPTELVKNHEKCGDSLEAAKAMYTVNKSPTNEMLMVQKSQEKSYEISPYQCSDDEEEEYEELPTKKYVPSWASKRSVALLLPLQHEMDHKAIFPPDSFCCLDEVPLSRKVL